MRKVLQVGVAALSVLGASAAHADVLLPPTDPLIGNWCEPHVPEDKGLYYRGSVCQSRDLAISREGYGAGRAEEGCTFLEIKRTPNGIETFSKCTAESLDKPLYYENVKFQIIGKRLKIVYRKENNFNAKQIDTGDTHRHTCVGIAPTPDGYLNLRQGPGMNFKAVAKLLPGQRVCVDMKAGEWVHVRSMREGKEIPDGWVYGKYLDEKIETLEPPPPSGSVTSPPLEVDVQGDEILADWCKRNDPDTNAQSCKELQARGGTKSWPNWLLNDPPAVRALRP